MKLAVSPRSLVNIYVVDLALVDSPIGVLVRNGFIAASKPYGALTKLIFKKGETTEVCENLEIT